MDKNEIMNIFRNVKQMRTMSLLCLAGEVERWSRS